MSPVSLSDSVWLDFGTCSSTTGAAANADSTPTVTIAEDGTNMAYSPTVSNVATGLYRVQIDATAGNGFESGKRYSVYVTATVGGITGRDGIGEFEVLAVDLNTGVASVTGAVGSVTGSVTVGTNNDKTGYSLSGTQTFNVTGNITGNLSGSVGSVSGSVGSVTGAVGSVTGSVGSVVGLTAANLDVAVSTRLATASYTAPLDAAGTRSAVGLASANLDAQFDALPTAAEIVSAIMANVITESYRANGAAPTLPQFMSEVLAHLGEASISGTTKTIKKFDRTTTAETYTLDSATSPTSITRAS